MTEMSNSVLFLYSTTEEPWLTKALMVAAKRQTTENIFWIKDLLELKNYWANSRSATGASKKPIYLMYAQSLTDAPYFEFDAVADNTDCSETSHLEIYYALSQCVEHDLHIAQVLPTPHLNAPVERATVGEDSHESEQPKSSKARSHDSYVSPIPDNNTGSRSDYNTQSVPSSKENPGSMNQTEPKPREAPSSSRSRSIHLSWSVKHPRMTPTDSADALSEAEPKRERNSSSNKYERSRTPIGESTQAKFITVIGPRGVGTTTVATALAQGLSRLGETLLLEFTLESEMGYLHGMNNTYIGLAEIISSSAFLSDSMQDRLSTAICKPDGVDYSLLAGLSTPLQVNLIQLDVLHDFLAEIADRFRYVVVDANPYLGTVMSTGSPEAEAQSLLTRTAIRSSSRCIITTQSTRKWLFSSAKLLKQLKQLEDLPASTSIVVNRTGSKHLNKSFGYQEVEKLFEIAMIGSPLSHQQIEIFKLRELPLDISTTTTVSMKTAHLLATDIVDLVKSIKVNPATASPSVAVSTVPKAGSIYEEAFFGL